MDSWFQFKRGISYHFNYSKLSIGFLLPKRLNREITCLSLL
ncbi:hypothetical protein [Niallia nealsonii]|nr:hypothetical protein [Niallia nealsonii]